MSISKGLIAPLFFFTAFFASAGEYDDAEWFGNGEQPNISLVRSADAIWSDDKQYEGDLITGGLNEMPETGWLTSGDHLPVKVNLKLTGQIKEGVVNALLSVRLDDDWKIYWRAPGEGGVAPKLEWESASVNVKDVNWL